MPGSKRSGLKKHMDGTVSKRMPSHTYERQLPRINPRQDHRFISLTDDVVLVRTYTTPNHDVIAALNNPDVMRYSEQRHRDHTVSTQRRYLDDMTIAGNLALGIFIQNPKEYTTLVGTMGCTVDKHNKLLDMGVLVLPKYAGQGFGRRAWRLVMEWALGDGGFEKVEAGYHEHNLAMFSICSDTGMVLEGTRVSHFRDDDGKRRDVVYWGKWK